MLTCMPQTPRLPPPAAAATAARWPQAARSLCVCLAQSPVEGGAVRSATPPTTARPTPELRATLQALRERKRERQMTSFYSAPTGEAPRPPLTAGERQEEGLRHAEMVQLRTRLNTRLSKANACLRFCDVQVEQRNEAVARLYEELLLCKQDVESIQATMRNIGNVPAKTVTEDVVARGEVLATRLATTLEYADAQRVRPVTIAWTGLASDVRIMGSFDEWTRGEPLQPEIPGSWTTWTGTLNLVPGTYEIKFLIDSTNWRVAPDWPCVGEGDSANNILLV